MTHLINFSHPLADEAVERLGKSPYSVHQVSTVPVHINFNDDLSSQVNNIVKTAIAKANNNPLDIDLIIPPGHSSIAVLVVDTLTTLGARPKVVTMKKDGIASPFMPDKIVGLRNI